MAQTYRSREGDVVDEIAWRQYGVVNDDVLAAVFAANPGLADRGAALPAGVLVTLPDIPNPSAQQQAVTLWD